MAPVAEKRVAILDVGMHQGQMDAARQRQALPVDLGTADDHQGIAAGEGTCLLHGADHPGVARRELRRAAHDDVGSLRQGLAYRFIGLAAHQHRLADGQRLEMPQIRRQVPGQPVAASDDVVFGRRDHQFQHRCHPPQVYEGRAGLYAEREQPASGAPLVGPFSDERQPIEPRLARTAVAANGDYRAASDAPAVAEEVNSSTSPRSSAEHVPRASAVPVLRSCACIVKV
jgi:hypothetical protein